MKHVLFMVRTAPYGSAAIPESVRACLGFASMPFEVSYLLMDDAVWALQRGQQPEVIGAPSVTELIGNLTEADVTIYADRRAVIARGLDPDALAVDCKLVSHEEIADLISRTQAVLNY